MDFEARQRNELIPSIPSEAPDGGGGGTVVGTQE